MVSEVDAGKSVVVGECFYYVDLFGYDPPARRQFEIRGNISPERFANLVEKIAEGDLAGASKLLRGWRVWERRCQREVLEPALSCNRVRSEDV